MVAVGASNLFFSKDTRVFIRQNATAGAVPTTNVWEIPILDGYAFNQTTNTTDVAINEMADSAGVSRRGRKIFTDSFAPVEWSFSTYIKPYTAATKTRAVGEVLWANFVANNSFKADAPAGWLSSMGAAGGSLDIDFNSSNKVVLGTYDIYIILGASNQATAGTAYNFTNSGDTTIYRITGAVANEVTMNFDLDGLATLNWSGMASTITEVANFDASAAIVDGISATNQFIRNRLTQLSAVSSVSGSAKTYAITLTGGSITVNNGITFITPETIGRVNQPLGHVTGTRTVSGTFTAYLDEKTNGSIELYEDLSNAYNVITNSFALDFYVGGKGATDLPQGPGFQIKIPQAHVSLPSINVADAMALEVTFNALPSTIGGTDEISRITYVAA